MSTSDNRLRRKVAKYFSSEKTALKINRFKFNSVENKKQKSNEVTNTRKNIVTNFIGGSNFINSNTQPKIIITNKENSSEYYIYKRRKLYWCHLTIVSHNSKGDFTVLLKVYSPFPIETGKVNETHSYTKSRGYKESEEKISYKILDTLEDIWNNPVFTSEMAKTLNEETYQFTVIVLTIQAVLKNLPLGPLSFISTSEK
ncbi:hypothetical protein Glove_34g31 [Diversispora epigaea]|uniref:Uncharacterized protein n=1 Tax=Diversispora epigaea TaxID=1348612 RepID=A0A397JSW8_9GLOM|nr:hypothetical protein Glove_34g31 [Diversispora epigaea]